MDKETLEKYKQSLLKEKKELEDELSKIPLVSDMGSDTEGEDYSEETDEAEEMVNNAAVRQPLKERLWAINKALEKIKE